MNRLVLRPAVMPLNTAFATQRMVLNQKRLIDTLHQISKFDGPSRRACSRAIFLCIECSQPYDLAGSEALDANRFYHLCYAKDKAGGRDSVEMLIPYEQHTRNYYELDRLELEVKSDFDGWVIFASFRDAVEQWTERGAHPFGELTLPPRRCTSLTKESKFLASKFRHLVVHQFRTNLWYEPPRGFGRFICGVSESWDIDALVESSASFVDLLGLHEDYHSLVLVRDLVF
jgi:hypothetical protein